MVAQSMQSWAYCIKFSKCGGCLFSSFGLSVFSIRGFLDSKLQLVSVNNLQKPSYIPQVDLLSPLYLAFPWAAVQYDLKQMMAITQP